MKFLIVAAFSIVLIALLIYILTLVIKKLKK